MLATNNNIDFKKVNKNLKNELSKLGFDISNQSSYNLLSRALGYKDYNTISNNLNDVDIKMQGIKETENITRIISGVEEISSRMSRFQDNLKTDLSFDRVSATIEKYQYYFRNYGHRKNILIYPSFNYGSKEDFESFENEAQERDLPYIVISIKKQWASKAIKNIQVFFKKEIYSDNKVILEDPSIREIELILEQNGIVDRESPGTKYPITFEVISKIKNNTRDEIESLSLLWNDDTNQVVEIAAVLNTEQDNFDINLTYKPLQKEYTINSNIEDLNELAKELLLFDRKQYQDFVARHNSGDDVAIEALFFYIINEICEGYSSALNRSLEKLISDFYEVDYYDYCRLAYADALSSGTLILNTYGYKIERDYKGRLFDGLLGW